MKRVEQSSRFNEVVKVFERYGFGHFFNGNRKMSESLQENPEKRLQKALKHLGGGFLLGGIFLAHRVDLIPNSYCKELSRIKDNGPVYKFEYIEKTIIKDYSRPVNTVFDKMWEKPVESDTLTQIHKAKLTNGEIVFVKVIKEKAIEQVKDDIIIAKYLAEESNDDRIKEVVKEFSEHFNKKKTLRAEQTFLENSAQAYGSDYLPTPIEHLCTDKVLMFTFQKNKVKSKNQYASIQKEIKTIKGEIILLIIGILTTLITIGIKGHIKNMGGLIGITIIIVALMIGIQSKLRK
ncbi:AarF/ABC1/UbiB kinase family protein [Candidatus Woesearchaeota archaeon]|nr:AarF/ABC1/UbiB kinase family protein [Candidatus Woesearchaeota archaeon]